MSSQIGFGYGSESALTVTHLNSLASGSTWESAAQTNTTAVSSSPNIGYEDVQILVTVKTSSSSLASSPFCTVGLCGSIDGGTTWQDGVSGSEGTYTPGGNATVLGTINTPSTSTAYSMLFSVRLAVGAVPQEWVVTVTNSTGQALASSGNSVEIQGLYTQTS